MSLKESELKLERKEKNVLTMVHKVLKGMKRLTKPKV